MYKILKLWNSNSSFLFYGKISEILENGRKLLRLTSLGDKETLTYEKLLKSTNTFIQWFNNNGYGEFLRSLSLKIDCLRDYEEGEAFKPEIKGFVLLVRDPWSIFALDYNAMIQADFLFFLLQFRNETFIEYYNI